MGMREQFLDEYNSAVLASVSLPPELAEKYSVLSCLKDGERQVYLLDSGTERAVLKLQPSGLEVSLKLEYELLLKLSHPQLPRPLAYAEWNGHEYLVREYVEGASFAELVDARGPLPPKSVRAAAMSLCVTLSGARYSPSAKASATACAGVISVFMVVVIEMIFEYR